MLSLKKNSNPIYLDAAATEKLHPEAMEAMLNSFKIWANPSGVSQASKIAAQRLEQCRKEIKDALNIGDNAHLIFTSSASESNNLIFSSLNTKILISKFEHPSVYNHPNVEEIDIFDFALLEEKLTKQRYLVSVSLVNNESGMIVWSEELAFLVKKYESKLHVDGAQAKFIDFEQLKCDYLTISGHKIGGPVGVACLITKSILKPLIYGGGQEYNMRSGTQALPLIEGLTAALKTLKKREDELFQNILKKNLDKKYFFSNFVEASFADNVICLLTYEKSGTEVQAFLDLAGIIVGHGSSCSSGTIDSPRILNHFNQPSKNGIRISFGWHTTSEEVRQFTRIFNQYRSFL